MTQGAVNDAFEAVVAISLQGSEGQTAVEVTWGCGGLFRPVETSMLHLIQAYNRQAT